MVTGMPVKEFSTTNSKSLLLQTELRCRWHETEIVT
jgi:hypothetical protein